LLEGTPDRPDDAATVAVVENKQRSVVWMASKPTE
jgi:hypothetical protein